MASGPCYRDDERLSDGLNPLSLHVNVSPREKIADIYRL